MTTSELPGKPGIRPEVQDFFAPYHDQFIFNYGDDFEHFGPGFHRVPVTGGRWVAGVPQLATDIFICGSAMDAIAFNSVADNYAFIAVGSRPVRQQFEDLPKGRRYHLLFPKDELGAVCDIKAASFIRKQALSIRFDKHYHVLFRRKPYELSHLSLHALEKASGYRFNLRTHKPKNALTWTSSLGHRPYLPLLK